MDITKEEAEKKIEELQNHIKSLEKTEVKTVGIFIKTVLGSILFQSTKTTLVEAIREANLREANLRGADLRGADLSEADLREADLRGANLRGADLRGADLRGAELCNAKFYGRGGHKKLKRSQLTDFLTALGFDIED